MKAIRVSAFGAPDVLSLTELPVPVPGRDQVLIDVSLAGVPFGDTIVRSGAYPVPLPYVPGLEVAGTVAQTGAGVDPALRGATVVATTATNAGGYAEHAIADALDVMPVAPTVALDAALAVFQAGAVALGLADVVGTSPGDKVLVLAAAGRIGSLLVQELRRRETTVIAAVGAPEKRPMVLDLGAARAVLYHDPQWAEHVFDLGPAQAVFDGVGGAIGAQSLMALEPGRGRLALIGYASGAWTSADPQLLARRGLTVQGAIGQVAGLPAKQRRHDALTALAALEADRLRPLPRTTYPLASAAQAHADLEQRRTAGAVILAVREPHSRTA